MINKKISMIIILLLMLFSFIFVFFTNSKKEVSKYQLTEDLIYSGSMQYGVFSGSGTLETTDGTYTGNFIDGRFSGEGKFVSNDGWIYKATFLPKESSKKISITLEDKEKYYKDGEEWKK